MSSVDSLLYRLLEKGDPWRVLFTTYLLKMTRKEQVLPRLPRLLAAYPTPASLLQSSLRTVRRHLRPFGLWRKRAIELRWVAHRLATLGPPRSHAEAASLYGAGAYIADAYALFVLNDLTVSPEDYALRRYRRLRTHSPSLSAE